MAPYLCMFTDVAHVLLLALSIQQNVARAQSHNDPYDSVYYWFSPGRIAGIAIGVAVLLLLFLSLLIMVCRRRKRASVMVPTYPAEDVQSRTYPPWQQPQIPYYGPYGDPRWSYPAPSTAPVPYGRAKGTTPPRGARGSPEHVRPASSSEGQRIIRSEPVQRPAGQVQRLASTSQVQIAPTPSQAQTITSQDQAQNVVLSEAGTSSHPARVQEQVPPPQPAYTNTIQRSAIASDREPSPPPYSPPTEPLTTPGAYAAR